MDKVFLVTHDMAYESVVLIGIFTTRANAEVAAEAERSRHEYMNPTYESIDIQECPLDDVIDLLL